MLFWKRIDALKRDLSARDREITELRVEYNRLVEEHRETKRDIALLEADRRTAASEREKYQHEISKHEGIRSKHNKLQIEHAELSRDHKKLKEEADSLNRALRNTEECRRLDAVEVTKLIGKSQRALMEALDVFAVPVAFADNRGHFTNVPPPLDGDQPDRLKEALSKNLEGVTRAATTASIGRETW